METILSLLRHRIGLDPASIGADAIARTVGRRMDACGVADPLAYEERLRVSEAEWQELIDAVIVPETWFFRDGEPFALLQRHGRSRWTASRPIRPLRVLSIPCSTGEEPYSIAMALLDAGLSRSAFQIDAVDISRRVLQRCREAVYGSNSFRGQRLEFRDRYFTAEAGRYRLAPEVAGSVVFRLGNLLDDRWALGQPPYDVIFCRNLLIYFDAASRLRASERLFRLLADDGVLFAGHAETSYTVGPRFASLCQSRAFAYRKKLEPRVETGSRRNPPKKRLENGCGTAGHAAKGVNRLAVPSPGVGSAAFSRREEPPEALLEKAHRLANEGRIDVAAGICRELVEGKRAGAECHCLLGLLQEALGNRTAAEECYRTALSFDPDHYESLVHLALLAESRGERPRAAALRARAGQLQPRSKQREGAWS